MEVIIIKDRLRQLRKNLQYNQKDFAEKIGVTSSAISRLETGDINFTEQMIKSICREFKVDYIWFTTGEGEMFSETDDDILDTIDFIMSNENEFHKNLFKTLAKFDNDDLLALERMIDKYLKVKNKKAD